MPATNPFPGMNPYLEGRWGDFHASFIAYLRDAIQVGLPGDLRARMQQRVFVESDRPRGQNYFPDVYLYRAPAARATGRGDGGGVAVAAAVAAAAAAAAGSVATADPPLVVRSPLTHRRQTYIDIIDAATGGRVVTSIELLSPANKQPGAGRRTYRRKREDCLDARVNVVEIDLLRGGRRTTLAPVDALRARPPGDRNHVAVGRATSDEEIEVYPAPLRDRLPIVGVPLRAGEVDAVVALQPLVDLCHERGRYDDIDYVEPLDPPLPSDLAAWADDLLRSTGLLPSGPVA